MLPLFRAVVKFCITNRLFKYIVLTLIPCQVGGGVVESLVSEFLLTKLSTTPENALSQDRRDGKNSV